jgi:hypothetical protein
MTDFKGINPDKNLGANFNTNRNGQGAKSDQQAKQGDVAPAGDPYADLKMDPDRMLDLLATQAKFNGQVNFENTGIERAVTSFASAITPERHAQVSQMMSNAYADEFGSKPNQQLLQDLVDNYLIGGVSIQNIK